MSASNFLLANLGAEVAIPPDIREHLALHGERVEHDRVAPRPDEPVPLDWAMMPLRGVFDRVSGWGRPG